MTGTSINVYTKLYEYTITPVQYFTLNILVSALGENYMHISDYDYLGPRLNAS
jgi:hypothetical protein